DIDEQIAQDAIRTSTAGADGDHRGAGPYSSKALSKASFASGPRTTNTIRSRPLPPVRCLRTSATSIAAASSTGNPPTPVPNATSASDRAPSSSAFASVDAVARRITAEDVGGSAGPNSIVAAWITHRQGIEPAPVSPAS